MNQSISEELDTAFGKNEFCISEGCGCNGREVLLNIIQSKISQAITAEKKELMEKVEGLELTETYIGPLFNAGHSQAIKEVLILLEEK